MYSTVELSSLEIQKQKMNGSFCVDILIVTLLVFVHLAGMILTFLCYVHLKKVDKKNVGFQRLNEEEYEEEFFTGSRTMQKWLRNIELKPLTLFIAYYSALSLFDWIMGGICEKATCINYVFYQECDAACMFKTASNVIYFLPVFPIFYVAIKIIRRSCES